MRSIALAACLALGWPALGLADGFPRFERQVLDPNVGKVCYALTEADVNGDGKPDLVALTEDAVAAFMAPDFRRVDLLKGQTQKDNVCIAAHDVDGDGRVDFALGASWQPANTRSGGTLQWITRSGAPEGQWRVIPIGEEPTLHRIRWGNVRGDGKKQLVVTPLQGRGTKGPNWGEGQGIRVLVYSVPDQPDTQPWPVEVADDTLHTVHNLHLVDFDGDGVDEILLAAWEGAFLLDRDRSTGKWSRTRLGAGNQEANPFKGASELKLGTLADGRRYIATIEPWHGFQVVVYTPPASGEGLWDRQVIDQPVTWGHAVWVANLDDDGDQELIIGQRDRSSDPARKPAGPGVLVFDPKTGPGPLAFDRHVIDDGGVATEDAIAADFNGDGRVDIAAGGRATHNVVMYWNKAND